MGPEIVPKTYGIIIFRNIVAISTTKEAIYFVQ